MGLKIAVEPMKIEDLQDVMEIETLSFAVPWSRNSFLYELLENERAFYWVAKETFGRIIGYIGMWVVLDEGHITNVAVHPNFRRRGAGEALMNELIRGSRLNGVSHLTLEVRFSNQAAQQLYTKLGFVEAGIRRRYYADNNEDAIIMWRSPL